MGGVAGETHEFKQQGSVSLSLGCRVYEAREAVQVINSCLTRNPSGTLLPFLGSGFPYIIYTNRKKGTLIVIWLLGYQAKELQGN